MAWLALLRHGESEWNSQNLFAGWADIGLTPAGEQQALRAGDLLVKNGLLPDVVHTSLLRRSVKTAQLTLGAAERDWIPVRRSWRLNERHYGALQGKNRVQVREEFGEEQFMRWRRSYDTPPPPLPDDVPGEAGDPRYAGLGTVPRTESLRDVVQRLLPYWHDAIIPDLSRYPVVLVVAHGNSLRALKKHLDGLSDEEVVSVNVPTGIPLCYELDDATMRPARQPSYLDPQGAAAAIEAVANQGERQPPARLSGTGRPRQRSRPHWPVSHLTSRCTANPDHPAERLVASPEGHRLRASEPGGLASAGWGIAGAWRTLTRSWWGPARTG
jgi:2,3-bisphosphoglycerate-dependent phosphoglycerate mutase